MTPRRIAARKTRRLLATKRQLDAELIKRGVLVKRDKETGWTGTH